MPTKRFHGGDHRPDAVAGKVDAAKRALTVHLPDTRGVVISRWGRGNTKIGTDGVYTYSRLPGRPDGRFEALAQEHGFAPGSSTGTCPGSSEECESICVSADTPILTSDLRWVPAGDLRVGDMLVGFDESAPGKRRRRLRPARILFHEINKRMGYCIRMRSGAVVVTTPEHGWLVRSGHWRSKFEWMESRSLRRGILVPRFFHPWEMRNDRDGGYLAGIYDGEGYWTAGSVGFSQRPGPILDAVKGLLSDAGFSWREYGAKGRSANQLRINGRSSAMRFLGQFRPHRLLVNARFFGEPMTVIDMDEIVHVEETTQHPMVVMETDTGTFIADGYGAHNCYAKRVIGSLVWDVWQVNSLTEQLPDEPLPEDAKLVRIHVSGDFSSIDYINQWIELAWHRPDVFFFGYTRSWRFANFLPALDRLRALPNVQLFASMDRSISELPPVGWRRAWIENDDRLRQVRGDYWRVWPDSAPAYICPEEQGRQPNCQSCQYCITGQKNDVIFLLH